MIWNMPMNERNIINDRTYKFIVIALHHIQSWDMIAESLKSVEIWEFLQFKLETQDLRAL